MFLLGQIWAKTFSNIVAGLDLDLTKPGLGLFAVCCLSAVKVLGELPVSQHEQI